MKNTTDKLLDFLQQNQPPSQQLLSSIVNQRLSLQDPDLPALLEVEKMRDKLNEVVLHVEQFKEASNQEIAALKAEIKRREVSEATVPSQKIAKKTIKIPNIDFLLKLFTATILGTIVSGIATFYYVIPKEVETQRGKDLESLIFMDSDDGKAFKKMIELNKGYFPNKCQEDARKNGVSVIFKGKKEEKVCVLRIP